MPFRVHVWKVRDEFSKHAHGNTNELLVKNTGRTYNYQSHRPHAGRSARANFTHSSPFPITFFSIQNHYIVSINSALSTVKGMHVV